MTVVQRALTALLVVCSLWYVLAFLYVALFSIAYPFGMEWLEGHVMEIVARVARGEPVYVAPTLDYVPFMYTPFYYYAAAAFTPFFGNDFAAGRALSIVSTLGVAAVLFVWARALGSSRVAAWAAAGVYLAAYGVGGRWYDLARVDNLSMFLLLLGMAVLSVWRGTAAALLAAVLLALAFYTKQTTLLAFAPLLLWAMVAHRRDGWIAAVTTCGFIALIAVASNMATSGWFRFYVFDVPAGHGLDRQYLLGFFTVDLLKNWWPMLLAAMWLIVHLAVYDRRHCYRMLALAVGLLGASYIARIHWGGHVNVLLPMFAFFALVAADVISRCWPFAAAVLVQLLWLYYSPNSLLPGEILQDNNRRAVAAIEQLPGDVFVPELHFISWQGGKKSHVFGMAAFDIFRSDNARVEPVKQQLTEELTKAFAEKRFGAVMPGALLKLREADPYYTHGQTISPTFRYPAGLVRQQNPGVLLP